jgi:hypothetical protein
MYQLTGVGAHAARDALVTAQQALGLPAFGLSAPFGPEAGGAR